MDTLETCERLAAALMKVVPISDRVFQRQDLGEMERCAELLNDIHQAMWAVVHAHPSEVVRRMLHPMIEWCDDAAARTHGHVAALRRWGAP